MAARGDINSQDVEPILLEKWVKLDFKECLDRTGEFSKLKSGDYFEKGQYPVIDQGEKYISGFVNDKNLLYKGELPVIIFGDHTRIFKYVTDDFAVGADGTKILKPIKAFDPKFFFYYMNVLAIPSLGYSRHFKILNTIKVPLPPLPEQQRIVTKLDTLFGQLDRIKASMERIPQLLKDFRQKVLTQAVTGKLTEEWREGRELEEINEYESERYLLQKEAAYKKGQKSFKYKEAVTIEFGGRTKGIDDLFELPEKWKWVSIDQVVWNVSDGPHFSPKYVEKDKGIRFISGRNISYRGIDFSDAKFVSIEDHYEFIKRGAPEEGDVLLTKGGTTGIACVVDKDTNFSYWVHVALLKPIRKIILPNYLRDALTSSLLYNQSQALTHGVGNQDLGLTRMIYMALPLPPLEEQQEIVRRVESLFAKADRIEASYQKLKAKLEQLPQALLAKAFRGELVEQLPTDGDARDLLEQIKKLKEEGESKAKGTGAGKGRGKKLVVEDEVRMVAEDGARYGRK